MKMSKIPFNRIGNRPSFLYIRNNWTNARNTIGFVFIVCLFVYVLWTTSGNLTTTTTTTTATSTSNFIISDTTSSSSSNKLLIITSSDDDNNQHNHHHHYHHQQQRNINKLKLINIIDDHDVTTKSPNYIINLHNNNKKVHKFEGAELLLTKKPSRSVATSNKDETDIDNSLIKDILNVCNQQLEDKRKYIQNLPIKEYDNYPIIYFVTPTYPRREQFPEITRLGHTLMHVPKIHWIIADDCDVCNQNLDYLFIKFGIPFTHLSSPMPDKYRHKSPAPRGVANRRAALKWLRINNRTDGILYFGDDDNTFDLKLFSEIRKTKIVSMLPVGLIGEYAVSTPVIKDKKVVAFFDSWPAKRKWPVDMAGFAVNLKYLSQHPNATMPYRAGHEEDAFLRSIQLHINDIEPRANNCTEVLVWHTRTQKQTAPTIQFRSEYLDSHTTNLGQLFKELQSLGVSHPSETHGVKAKIIQNGKLIPFSSYFG